MFNKLVAALIILAANSASAATWIARCNNLQFNFNNTRSDFAGGLMYMNSNTPTGTMIIQVANGKIFASDARSVWAVFNRGGLNGTDFSDMSRIGIIKLSETTARVSVQYKNPTTGAMNVGTYCNATLQISP